MSKCMHCILPWRSANSLSAAHYQVEKVEKSQMDRFCLDRCCTKRCMGTSKEPAQYMHISKKQREFQSDFSY